MARTRKSDPGRAQALHYAAAQKQRHAKRLVYACLGMLWVSQPSAWASGPGGQAGASRQRPEAVPCVTCQVLSLSPDQVGPLPEALGGLRVALRVSPDAGPGEALQRVGRAGAVAGVHVLGVPDTNAPLMNAAFDLLIVEPGALPAGGYDAMAFALKRALAAARG